MTVIIDNYDSFTYNLAYLVAGVSGEMPLVVRNDEAMPDASYDRVIISPGPGRPDVARDFGISMVAIREMRVPVLGVCLGHQGIAVAFGGRVKRGEPMHGRVSTIEHNGDELFAGVPETFRAVRYHSLVVDEPLPEELAPIARSRDGVLMGLRHRTRPLWGVQFHPESILSQYGAEIVRNFLR